MNGALVQAGAAQFADPLSPAHGRFGPPSREDDVPCVASAVIAEIRRKGAITLDGISTLAAAEVMTGHWRFDGQPAAPAGALSWVAQDIRAAGVAYGILRETYPEPYDVRLSLTTAATELFDRVFADRGGAADLEPDPTRRDCGASIDVLTQLLKR